jgi:hypothetical protein
MFFFFLNLISMSDQMVGTDVIFQTPTVLNIRNTFLERLLRPTPNAPLWWRKDRTAEKKRKKTFHIKLLAGKWKNGFSQQNKFTKVHSAREM